MLILYAFLAGMFLTNGVPHLVKGITGSNHMTPFLKDSPAWLNVIWAFSNFILGLIILKIGKLTFNDMLSLDSVSIAFLAGSLFMALGCAKLFSNPNARLPWQK